MRALIQRVSSASVTIGGETTGKIGKGILVLVGIENADTAEDLIWLSAKISNLRIFDDENGVMNLSIRDIDGEALIVSQFTLHARVKKGSRPSYIDAAPPSVSIPLYESFLAQMESDLGKKPATGEFGAMMQVALMNDGPVTLWIDTKNKI